jgi:DNA modification methylase
MSRAIEFSTNGSIHYWCMDWRHLPELLRAGLPLYTEWKNLVVWKKANAGQGSFYRSHHELIAVFKAGTGPHINNFGLGSEGRYRTNVLEYPGGATPDAKRQEELQMHPTVKPVPLIADLMKDCSRRNGLVLDLFGGSGTALLAAEETGRRARVIELDPLYVDLAVRRWQRHTGGEAIHGPSGRTFDEMAVREPANG